MCINPTYPSCCIEPEKNIIESDHGMCLLLRVRAAAVQVLASVLLMACLIPANLAS